jgi:hypothetical protein
MWKMENQEDGARCGLHRLYGINRLMCGISRKRIDAIQMTGSVVRLPTPLTGFETVRKAMLDGLGIKVDDPQRPVVLYPGQPGGASLSPIRCYRGADDGFPALRMLAASYVTETIDFLFRMLKSFIDITDVHVVKLSHMKLADTGRRPISSECDSAWNGLDNRYLC